MTNTIELDNNNILCNLKNICYNAIELCSSLKNYLKKSAYFLLILWDFSKR